MLRIKKDVDLKELEKFGFKYYEVEGQYEGKKLHNCWNRECLIVNKNTRKVGLFIDTEYYECYTDDGNLELLFDLIQEGMVEKKRSNYDK